MLNLKEIKINICENFLENLNNNNNKINYLNNLKILKIYLIRNLKIF